MCYRMLQHGNNFCCLLYHGILLYMLVLLNDNFAMQWALMTLRDPANSYANLVYVGYPGEFSSAFTVTRKRRVDRKKQQTLRNVFQCYVFGARGSGKTSLLQSFIGRCALHFLFFRTEILVIFFHLVFDSLSGPCNRQPSDALPSNSERFATNSVELPDVCVSLTLIYFQV